MFNQIRLILTGFVVAILFITAGTLVSSQIRSTGGTDKTQGDLLKRIATVENEVAQLKKEMAGAKLIVTGLDKGLTSLKEKHESHTHRISAGVVNFEAVSMSQKAGQNPHIPVIYPNQLKADQAKYGAAGFFTTAPIKN